MADSSDSGPLVQLTRPWRIAVAIVAVALALGHLVFPTLSIDALFLGLLVVAVALIFFDIESFEFAGIKARRQKQELNEAKQALQQIDISAEPTSILLTPEQAESSKDETVTLGYQGLVHRPAVHQLEIPSDRLQRLLWAYEQIRIELIILAASNGHLPDHKSWEDYTVPELGTLLSTRNVIPSAITSPIMAVTNVRNSIVHTNAHVGYDVFESASEVALETLRTLREIKRTYIRVVIPNVPVYKDQSLSALIQDTGAVMIAQISDDGDVILKAVYPRYISYARGRFVSWEWDMSRVFSTPAWYEDPSTKTANLAWSASSTFVGREFPQQWGLEYRLPQPDIGLV